jgi:GNAT superfamily N-acetyltransferase
VRVLNHDELSSDLEEQTRLLDGTAGWGPLDSRMVGEARKLGYPAADYFGVYAVEKGQVLSMVRVLRVPFTTPDGTETVAGIQGVVTRRDQSRRKLARKLLEEVHRREKASGYRYVMLWTGRAMVAHGLYESLGYQDVYTPELAVKKCKDVAKPAGLEFRRIRMSETHLIEEMHRKAMAGRLGFTPRPDGIVDSVLKLGFRSLAGFWLLLRGGEPVGYSLFERGTVRSSIDELVLSGVRIEDALSSMESTVSGSWLSIRNTSVKDYFGALKIRGYSFSKFTYYGLMAAPLEVDKSANPHVLGTASKRFTCQQLDYF